MINLDIVKRTNYSKRVHEILFSNISLENKISVVRSMRPELLDSHDFVMWLETSDPDEVQRYVDWSESHYKWNRKRSKIMRFLLKPIFTLTTKFVNFVYDCGFVSDNIRVFYHDIQAFIVTCGTKPKHPKFHYDAYEYTEPWGDYGIYDSSYFPKSTEYLFGIVTHDSNNTVATF